MPETASIKIKYTGDSRGIVTETKQAERAMDQYGREIKQTTMRSQRFQRQSVATSRTLKTMGRGLRTGATAFAAIGAAASLAAVAIGVRFVSAGLKSVDVLGKQASALGISTEALAGYNRAAVVVGVEQGKVQKSIQKLARSLLDAEAGLTTYTRAFDALGLSSNELIKLAPDESFERLADALKSVESPTIKTALAMQLLGRAGGELLNFIDLGSAGMAQFREQTRIAGTALSADMVAKVEQANDAMSLLGELSTGLGQQLAVKLAPVLTAISESFFQSAKEAGGMGEVATKVFDAVVNGAVFVVNAIDGFVRVTKLAVVGFKFLGQSFASALNFMLKILNVSPAGIAVRTFMAAFGFFKGEGFHLPDYNDSAMAKLLDDWGLDIAGLAEEVDALLSEPLKGDKLRIFVADAQAEFGKVEIAVVDVNQVLLDTDTILEAMGGTAKTAAETAAAAWTDTARQMQSAIGGLLQLFGVQGGGQIGNLFGAFFGGGQATGGGAFLQAINAGGSSGGFGGTLTSLAGTAASQFLGGGNLLGSIGNGVSGALGFNTAGRGILQTQAGQAFSGLFGGFGGSANLPPYLNASTATSGTAAAGANIIGGLATAAAGYVGTQAGNALGEALFNKQAANNKISTGGAIAGAFAGAKIGGQFGGVWGAAIGALIGAIADVGFGGDGQKRAALGIATGSARVSRAATRRDEIATSGLRLRSTALRSGTGSVEAVDAMLNTFLAIDEALSNLTARAGVLVDFSDTVLGSNTGQAGDPGRTQDFFGLFGFNGLNQGSGLAESADEFVRAWLAEVNEALPKRVALILSGANDTAANLVAAFEAALSIDELLNLDVVNRTAEALAEFGEQSKTLFETYQDLTAQTREYATQLDGSDLALQVLNDSLFTQKQTAVELAVLYQGLQGDIDAALGGAITSIRESLLNDEELYALRQSQIADLTASLTTAISPERIGTLATEIERLTTGAFNALTPEQQATAAPQFIDFLERINELSQQQLTEGLGQLGVSEDQLQADLDTQFAAAADRFLSGTVIFNEAVLAFIEGLNLGSIADFDWENFDITDLFSQEVNG